MKCRLEKNCPGTVLRDNFLMIDCLQLCTVDCSFAFSLLDKKNWTLLQLSEEFFSMWKICLNRWQDQASWSFLWLQHMLLVVCWSFSTTTHFRGGIRMALTISIECFKFLLTVSRPRVTWSAGLRQVAMYCHCLGEETFCISCNLFETKIFCFYFDAIQSKTAWLSDQEKIWLNVIVISFWIGFGRRTPITEASISIFGTLICLMGATLHFPMRELACSGLVWLLVLRR